MKKILLLIAFISLHVHAQTVVYSNNFSASTGLSIIDADGDTANWGLFTGSATTATWGLTGNFAGSRSWNPPTGTPPGPLTPDNFLITDPITIPTTANTSTVISFKLGANDPSAFSEKISVYVFASTITTAAGIIATTPVFTRVLTSANAQTALTYTADISASAGQTVRIAMRHYDCTDQNILYFDDLAITQNSLSNTEFFSKNFTIYPNPTNDIVNISKNSTVEIKSVTVTDMNGRIVKEIANEVESINIAELSAGVYFLKINTAEGTATTKLVKN